MRREPKNKDNTIRAKAEVIADEIRAFGIGEIPDGSGLRQPIANSLGVGQYVSFYVPTGRIVFITLAYVEKLLTDTATVKSILATGKFEITLEGEEQ